MATSIISGIETFNLAAESGFTGSGRGFYDSSTGLVRINLYAANANAWDTNTQMFSIPVKYRPRESVYGSAFYSTATGQGATTLRLDSDGRIFQRGNSAVRTVMGYIEYKAVGTN